MGKLRHNKDRGFLTGVEWKELGGFKEKRTGSLKRLPFDHCALSLVPFETPMLAPDGSVFELTRIIPFLKKHHKNPVSAEPLESKDLLALHFAKNTDGNYICPVTGKPLTEHSRIVVIRVTGNVFSFDAVNQLCLVPKNMKDLLDDTPFVKSGEDYDEQSKSDSVYYTPACTRAYIHARKCARTHTHTQRETHTHTHKLHPSHASSKV
jgi:peptidyl-prolyl cis-trans isomerase-like 2